MSDKLLALDREFNRETSLNGLEGWVKHFAVDGTMLTKTGNNIEGHAEIRKAMEGFFALKELKFTWEPENSRLSKSEDLGYTYGTYLREYINNGGEKVAESGRYITIWELQSDGTYRVSEQPKVVLGVCVTNSQIERKHTPAP